MAPAKTPRDIVQKLNTEVGKILASKEIRDRYQAEGLEPQGGFVQGGDGVAGFDPTSVEGPGATRDDQFVDLGVHPVGGCGMGR